MYVFMHVGNNAIVCLHWVTDKITSLAGCIVFSLVNVKGEKRRYHLFIHSLPI
jgi:hypothetical protein